MSFKNASIVGVNCNSEEYHRQNAARGTMEFIVSPSALKGFADCPEEWIEEGKQLAVLTERLAKATDPREKKVLRRRIESIHGSTLATKWGNLVDARLLTPDQFEQRYAVQPDSYEETVLECPECGSVTESPRCRNCKVDRLESKHSTPWSSRSEHCQKWAGDQIAAGREVINKYQLEDCDTAIARLMAKPICRKLIECSEKQVHVQGEWHDPGTGLIIPARCLIDFAPRANTEFVPDVEPDWPQLLGDMKQCNTADLLKFGRKVFDFRWHVQAMFDLDLFNAATGEQRFEWMFLGQKNFGVWQPFKRLLAEDYKTLGRAEYRRLLHNYCQCLKSNRWPDYDDTDEALVGCGVAAPDPYMAERAQFAPQYRFGDDEEEEEDAPPLHELEVTP